ncbi:NAD-dependent protein deacylase [Peribacillus sp. SCS-155]|uniref:NAD-dependent protein deacylase n=1 Tax=Peribacillus sedimenti TaxID=3115297 RepID=UPI003906D361
MKEAEQLDKLESWIDSSIRIAVLTGAGVSTESGLKDFRSEAGWFNKDEPIEAYLSRPYFNRNPEKFWNNYKQIFHLSSLDQYEPNSAHLFLKALERQGKDVTIITQNVDGLHHKAGSSKVIEVHGSVMTPECPLCGCSYEFSYVLEYDTPVCKQCGTVLNPGIVLYGDAIHGWEEAEEAVMKADLFLVMGTSLSVSPVNMLPTLAKTANVRYRVLINEEVTPMNDYFNLFLQQRLGAVFERERNENQE